MPARKTLPPETIDIEITKKITVEERFLGVISYLSVLFLISLLKRNSDFVKFHAKQGMLLFFLTILINFAGNMIPIIGQSFVIPIGNLIIFIIAIISILHAATGKTWKLPYGISELASKIKL